MGWVDAPTEAEEAEAREGCPGSFETQEKLWIVFIYKCLELLALPRACRWAPVALRRLTTSRACLETLAQP